MSKQNILDQLGEGIIESFDPELKRAFDFEDSQVPSEVKKPESLRFYPDKLKISGDGVFYTLQGEGITMGLPAVFLRLHVCNLRCSWCDAWYTWNPKTEEFWTESQDWGITETVEKIKKAWKCKNSKINKRLIITGGEPLIQQDKIIKLIKKLPKWKIEIETNGTLIPNNELIMRCQFNCSPKLSNSLNHVKARINPQAISALKNANTMFKFVVMYPIDVEEINSDYIQPFNIDPNKIVIMPQGVTSDEVKQNAQRIAEIAKLHGYRLLLRLHVDLWGAKRRV